MVDISAGSAVAQAISSHTYSAVGAVATRNMGQKLDSVDRDIEYDYAQACISMRSEDAPLSPETECRQPGRSSGYAQPGTGPHAPAGPQRGYGTRRRSRARQASTELTAGHTAARGQTLRRLVVYVDAETRARRRGVEFPGFEVKLYWPLGHRPAVPARGGASGQPAPIIVAPIRRIAGSLPGSLTTLCTSLTRWRAVQRHCLSWSASMRWVRGSWRRCVRALRS
jgi:hypothetical protein